MKLKESLSAAEEKNHDMDGEIKRQREEIEKLKRKSSDLEEKLSDHEKRISILEEEKAELIIDNRALTIAVNS